MKAYKTSIRNEPFILEEWMNSVGYNLLTDRRITEALEIFKLNVELYPESWNVYDSLAEAFMVHGNFDKAEEYYKKSLEINPSNEAAKNQLKKLR